MTALESPYLQVAQQSKQAMRLGMLSVGDQPVINPNIVLKAYRELEQEELVGSRPGQGTFVLRLLVGVALASHVVL